MRWAVILLVGIFLFSFAGAAVPDDCHEDMVAYWQFENNLLDGLGNSDNDGVWGGVGAYNDFQVGNGSVFNAGNEMTVDSARNDLELGSSFTIEMWVMSEDSQTAVLFDKSDYEIEWIAGLQGVGQINASVSRGASN